MRVPTPGSGARERGFTLLEIVIVITVLAIVVAMALPRQPDVAGIAVRKNARKAASVLQVARLRAVSLRRFYRVEVDLDRGEMSVSYYGPQGTFIADEEVRLTALTKVRITDVVTVRDGKVAEGKGLIHISPRGFTEPSLIHLEDEQGRALTLMPSLISERVRIRDGYLDLGSTI
ncbi:MAG: prepilin-type N-terminal cleavage/methylation domain-containing protein [bacterium]|nr:MAG: prepilin-type N-terminal cleavage/methylation domain-containing protein [bacterium]